MHLDPGNRIKVLHFVTGGFSGATQVAVDLCLTACSDPGFEAKLVLRKKRTTSSQRVTLLQGRSLDVSVVPGWSHLATILALRKICKQWRPDILVAHGFSEHLWGRIAGLWAGVPTLIHVEHNSRERYTPWRLWLARWLAHRTAAIVGVSEGVKKHLLELGFPSEKCQAIPNGIDRARFDQVQMPAWSSRKPAVIMASRFARQKDHQTLIQAISLLERRGLHIELSFAGTGKKNLLKKAQKTCTELGIAGNVQFFGQVQDLPQRLSEHQVFVLSTHYEGMPLALIEAMACGCACIGSDVVGVSEIIEHGKTGWLVPEGDAQKLAYAIESVLARPDQAHAIAMCGRKYALDHFTTDLMHSRYRSLLQSAHRIHSSSNK